MESEAGQRTKEELVWDFYFSESSLVSARTDWFLIFHGILMEAFFAAHRTERLAVGTLGAAVAFLWFGTGLRQKWLLDHLGACMQDVHIMYPEVANRFRAIFTVRRGIPGSIGWARPVTAFVVVMPAAFVAAWMVLLVFLSERVWWTGLVAGLAGILVVFISVRGIRYGPDTTPEYREKFLAPVAQDHTQGT